MIIAEIIICCLLVAAFFPARLCIRIVLNAVPTPQGLIIASSLLTKTIRVRPARRAIIAVCTIFLGILHAALCLARFRFGGHIVWRMDFTDSRLSYHSVAPLFFTIFVPSSVPMAKFQCTLTGNLVGTPFHGTYIVGAMIYTEFSLFPPFSVTVDLITAV